MEGHHNQATIDRFMKRKEISQSLSRPATAGPSANSSASVDELQRVVGGLDISATLPVSHIDIVVFTLIPSALILLMNE